MIESLAIYCFVISMILLFANPFWTYVIKKTGRFMHIDWFVFFAQIVNFLILLFLLKKFLDGWIINAMDAREAKDRGDFRQAEECSRRPARKPRSMSNA